MTDFLIICLMSVPDGFLGCVCAIYIFFIGPAMVQAVSCHPLTIEAKDHPQANMRGIFGGQSCSGRGISFENFSFPLLVSFHPGCTLLFRSSTSNTVQS
jgi:hypothetical protein